MDHKFEALEGLPRASDNPYVQGRREFLERYGDLVTARDQWRRAAIWAASIAALAVAGVVYIGAQSKIVPHIVQVDRLGSVGAVQRVSATSAPDPTIVRAQLARWINATRSVYVDATAQRAAIDEAYAMLVRASPAHGMLNEYFRAASPFTRAETETVTPQIHSVLPIGGNTWRAEWTEVIRGRNGELIREDEYQASLTVAVTPPKDEEELRRNPLGIYVPEFAWTKRLSPNQGVAR